MVGWEFKVNAPLSVTKLGFFDSGSNGLANPSEVGIFDVATQTLMYSQTIPGGTAAPTEGPAAVNFFAPAMKTGEFRYVSIPPLALTAGKNYAIIGINTGYAEGTGSGGNTPVTLTLAPELTMVQGRTKFFYSSSILVWPSNGGGGAEIGPSFQFTAAGPPPPPPPPPPLVPPPTPTPGGGSKEGNYPGSAGLANGAGGEGTFGFGRQLRTLQPFLKGPQREPNGIHRVFNAAHQQPQPTVDADSGLGVLGWGLIGLAILAPATLVFARRRAA